MTDPEASGTPGTCSVGLSRRARVALVQAGPPGSCAYFSAFGKKSRSPFSL